MNDHTQTATSASMADLVTLKAQRLKDQTVAPTAARDITAKFNNFLK